MRWTQKNKDLGRLPFCRSRNIKKNKNKKKHQKASAAKNEVEHFTRCNVLVKKANKVFSSRQVHHKEMCFQVCLDTKNKNNNKVLTCRQNCLLLIVTSQKSVSDFVLANHKWGSDSAKSPLSTEVQPSYDMSGENQTKKGEIFKYVVIFIGRPFHIWLNYCTNACIK